MAKGMISLFLAMICFIVGPAYGQMSLQGEKLILTQRAGVSVAVSADGNTMAIGNPSYLSDTGGVYIYIRNGSQWIQEGDLLTGYSTVNRGSQQGTSVALSADGNTLAVGGPYDGSTMGAVWIFTRQNTYWRQADRCVGNHATGTVIYQGTSVSLSADGVILASGGPNDNNGIGAVWIFKKTEYIPMRRAYYVWLQVAKLVGNDFVSVGATPLQGRSVSLSADGKTLAVGGYGDKSDAGATWIYLQDSQGNWNQSGNKLSSDQQFRQASFVKLSGDGNTLVSVSLKDLGLNIYTRAGTVWSKQAEIFNVTDLVLPSKRSASASVSLSNDGNILAVGFAGNNDTDGAVWVFLRTGGSWKQYGKSLIGSPGSRSQLGSSVSLSAKGNILAIGAPTDTSSNGTVYVYGVTYPNPVNPPSPTGGVSQTSGAARVGGVSVILVLCFMFLGVWM